MAKTSTRTSWLTAVAAAVLFFSSFATAEDRSLQQVEAARALTRYFEAMSAAKPFRIREGDSLEMQQKELRARLLSDVGLEPLPEPAMDCASCQANDLHRHLASVEHDRGNYQCHPSRKSHELHRILPPLLPSRSVVHLRRIEISH